MSHSPDATSDETPRTNATLGEHKCWNDTIFVARQLERELAQKEADRQYHMNAINHLASEIGALGMTSDGVIQVALIAIRSTRSETAPTAAQEEVKTHILAERDKGNLTVMGIEGLMSMPIEEFVKQPADGMLYDLNRGEEISLTFIHDRKWVNDFAVALVIRKLVEQRDAALKGAKPSARATSTGVEAIAAERERQVKKEGWDEEHDDAHPAGSLGYAGVCYAISGAFQLKHGGKPHVISMAYWPWEEQWWKPKDARSDLVRAGALIAAEIDRLDREAK